MQKLTAYLLVFFINMLYGNEHGLDVLSQRMDSLYQSDNDSAIWCGEMALHIADSLGLDSMQVSLHSRLGFIHKSQGEMYRAMLHYEKAVRGRTVEPAGREPKEMPSHSAPARKGRTCGKLKICWVLR